MCVFDETLARIFVRGAAGAIRMMPVHQRVVKADAQPFGSRSFDVLTHQIASGALLGGAVVRQLCVPQTEALMMLGGHHHIFLSGAASQPRPVARGIGFGREVLCQQLILSDGNGFVLHRPLVLANHTVQSPMNEYSEARLMPPLHAACAVCLGLRSFFGMLVRNLSWQSASLAVGVGETGCSDCARGAKSLQKMTA